MTASAATTKSSEQVPPDVQQIPVQETVGDESKAVPTQKQSADLVGSEDEDAGEKDSLNGVVLPPGNTPQPAAAAPSTLEQKSLGATGAIEAASCAAAPPRPASATASRTICLRTLREGTPSTSRSNLAGWGGMGGAVAAATATATSVEEQGVSGKHSSPSLPPPTVVGQGGGARLNGGGLGVLSMANKVVDLREVKKVKPGPLAASPAEPIPSDDSDGVEESVGSVKIDISVGKRMIEFQLNQNAAEEKREAARLKNERERADAARAEESQRMLAMVNARMEAQRRERGAVLGSWGSSEISAHFDHGSGGAEFAMAPSEMRNLAEKHGILVKFMDDGAASGIAQVRALARAHGIRIKVLGGEEDGEEEEEGRSIRGDGVANVVGGGGETTPPPVLPSLRTRTGPTRSTSPVPQTTTKAPARKPPATPVGGMFTGPARMMRKALEARAGCTPSAKDASPLLGDRGKQTLVADAAVTTQAALSVSDDGKKKSSLSAKVSDGPPSIRAVSSEGAIQSSKGGAANETKKDGGTGPRPGSTQSTSSRVNGVRSSTLASTGSRNVGAGSASLRKREDGVGTVASAAAAAVASGKSTTSVSGRKRQRAQQDSTDLEGQEGSGVYTVRATSKGVSGAVNGGVLRRRMEARLGDGENGLSLRQLRGISSARGLPDKTSLSSTSSSRQAGSEQKRMRLVSLNGEVVSKASVLPSTARPARRPTPGGSPWAQGKNNLFKGAMAGIVGRGKRPAP